MLHRNKVILLQLSHKFSNYDRQLIYKKLVDKKKDSVKIDILPKTNEESKSVTYGIRFIDSYGFLSTSLDSIVTC